MTKLTVCICTRNRAAILRGALGSLSDSLPPEHLAWEALVVLNDCGDDSASVVEEFRARLPVRWIAVPRVGLSNARNGAIDAATGDAILWIDDDVRVRREWMRSYEKAFLRWPEASVLGGPVEPIFEGDVPRWLQRALPAVASAFALRAAPPEGARIDEDNVPYGANFAIRTDVQRLFPFDPHLGRTGERLRGGEETAVIRAILQSGREGRWLASAVVDHVIPPERQTVAYVRAYDEAYGRYVGELDRRNGGARSVAAVKDLASALSAELRYRVSRLVAPPELWARDLRRAARLRGRWIGRYL